MNKLNKKGSIMVDAAICFPVFILAAALLLNLMLLAKQEENCYSRMAEKALSLRNGAAITLYTDENQELIYLSESTKKGSVNLCFRPFMGATEEEDYNKTRVFIFPKNEGEEKENPKYHCQNCYQLRAHKKDTCISVTKTEAENRGYKPCSICGGTENEY